MLLTQFFSLGLVMLLSAMLPGPDVAMVIKNTLYSRRAGMMTTLGIVSAMLVHLTYCMMGLGILLKQSNLLFHTIKWIGAAYLIYLGITTLLNSSSQQLTTTTTTNKSQTTVLSSQNAYQQGFLCNLLNPKAALFFLALFTVLINPATSLSWQFALAFEMIIIASIWFTSLTYLISHPIIMEQLNRIEFYLNKLLSVCLIGFGCMLVFVK